MGGLSTGPALTNFNSARERPARAQARESMFANHAAKNPDQKAYSVLMRLINSSPIEIMSSIEVVLALTYDLRPA
jgi:hypothetical protein